MASIPLQKLSERSDERAKATECDRRKCEL